MARSFKSPSNMKAWQYSTSKGGLEKNLKLNTVPLPVPKPNQHLVQVIAASLNPVDYKGTEHPMVGWLAVPKPATPGNDFSGVIVKPAVGSPYKAGDIVFGCAGDNPLAGGAIREFCLVKEKFLAPVPDGISALEAASITIAGMSAYQSIIPRVKKGDKIFINGGSGGTGMFGIQIAKIAGCHVTVTCSTTNIDLCKNLGADVVIDYKENNVLQALLETGVEYDHVVDNVGMDEELIWKSYLYAKPNVVYTMVGGTPAISTLVNSVARRFWPSFLGGMRNKYVGYFVDDTKPEHASQVAQWMVEGKIRLIVDRKFPFEEVPEAFAKLKTSRAKGKILINVASETYRNARTEEEL